MYGSLRRIFRVHHRTIRPIAFLRRPRANTATRWSPAIVRCSAMRRRGICSRLHVDRSDAMTPTAFNLTLSLELPPRGLAPPVEALWWAAKGDWDKAHRIVMEEDGANAAWVHAYLHRVEGDLPNAGYWYRAAGKPVCPDALEAEWSAIAAALLAP